MPVTYYRCTLFWTKSTFGPSETYIIGSANPDSAATALNDLLTARSFLMFTSDEYAGVRVAVMGAQRQSKFLRPGGAQKFPGSATVINIPAAGSFNKLYAGTQTLTRNTLLLSVPYDGDSRYARRYLSGVPAGIVGEDPTSLNLSGNGNWANRLTAFLTLLASGPYFLAAQNQQAWPQLGVANLLVSTAKPGYLSVSVSGTVDPAYRNSGLRVQLYNFRAKKGTRSSTINGQWSTLPGNLTDDPPYTSVVLAGSTGIDPTSQRIFPKTSIQLKFTTQYQMGLGEPVAVVPRKRGKSAVSPRGRRLIRPSLDG